jgi:glycosyltransferase involved in cell wall biosynthesis
MTDVPSVSVVLPCYNVADFAESAIERLLGQEDVDLEIIAVDDASTDDTPRILARLAERHKRVHAVLLDENAGVAAARESAVGVAKGTYVWFVDADDDWPTDAAALLVAAAVEQDADVVCAEATVVAEGRSDKTIDVVPAAGPLNGPEVFALLLTGDVTGHLWNKLFRRDLLSRITFTRIRQHSDQAMVAQAFVEADRVAILHRPVYLYRLRQGSIIRSGSKRAESLRALGDVIASCASRVDARALEKTEYLYYRARFSTLSRLKDATSGAYADGERTALVKEIRRQMSIRQLAALVRRRDATRTAIYTLAWLTPRGYAVLLDRAGGRL